MKNITKILSKKSLGFMILLILALVSAVHIDVYAYSMNDQQSIVDNTPWFDSQDCAAGNNASATDSSTIATTGTASWNSGLQPQYYLEEFAVNILEDLAKTMNVPTTSTVTQEHVLYMVAWFWTEGGDIANSNLFNPLNTKYTGIPSLISGYNGEFPSYASFDAGVQANTLTLVGHFQTRIAEALANPATSAEQVESALANWQQYPGNAAWGTDPTNLSSNIEQARKNYASEASTILGTAAKEASTGAHVPIDQLKFIPSGSSTAISGSTTLTSDVSESCPDASTISSVHCDTNQAQSQTADVSSNVGNTVACIAQQQLAIWSAPGGPPGGPAQYCKTYSFNDGTKDSGWCPEWCADFASWVYKQAGYPFSGGGQGGWQLPAVDEIESLGQQNKNFTWHPSNYTPKIGDLVIHKNGDSHVNIVIGVSGNNVTMIGGDQGKGPYGGPDSKSIVSTDHANGFFSGDITGYVSPNQGTTTLL